MRIVALLCWYDEDPAWLAGLVASLSKADVSHVVALDGAYLLYPLGKPWSSTEQHAAILETARGAGLGCTIHAPDQVWMGNEVEKRSFHFRLAEPIADWYLIVDADCVVTQAARVAEDLEATDLDVAEVALVQRHGPGWADPTTTRLRCLFRAIPGLCFDGAHYRVTTPDGRRLWGERQEDALDLSSSVKIEHRPDLRPTGRKHNRDAYYSRRDDFGAERIAEEHGDALASAKG